VKRSDLLEVLVLNVIGDNYEDLAHIGGRVGLDAGDCGMNFSLPELTHALAGIIRRGWASAYRLSGKAPYAVELAGVPPAEEIADFYHTATAAGLAILAADIPGWPFDDHGKLLPGWSPPAQ
jgi:hypothetical protein